MKRELNRKMVYGSEDFAKCFPKMTLVITSPCPPLHLSDLQRIRNRESRQGRT